MIVERVGVHVTPVPSSPERPICHHCDALACWRVDHEDIGARAVCDWHVHPEMARMAAIAIERDEALRIARVAVDTIKGDL